MRLSRNIRWVNVKAGAAHSKQQLRRRFSRPALQMTASILAVAGLSATLISSSTSAASAPITFIGAGDIAASGGSQQSTAALLGTAIAADPATVVWTAGDNAYESGTTTEFNTHYAPNWGQYRTRTKPTPGNHEYQTANATGYFNYFCPTADNCVFPGGTQQKYYSYNVGNWHVLALNSEVEFTAGSPQMQWIQADLAANQGKCTAAVFHKPLFNSGTGHGPNPSMKAFWDVLYPQTDVILNGHEHIYERFAKQTPAGVASANGIRQFIVGTGGAELYGISTPRPNSEARAANIYGVLKLTLNDTSYSWQFMPAAGYSYNDSGSENCKNASADPFPTVSVTAPAANATVQGSAVTLSANASDNVSVAGVQFKVDGTNVGAEDTTAPYSVSWNSTTASEGQHAITAVARDSAGQLATSVPVNVTVDNVPDTTATVDRRVAASADDAEQNNNASPNLTSTDLELVTDGTAVQTVGMRFTNVTVPRGATIRDAYVQFATDETGSNTAPLVVRGEAVDNATAFTTSTNNLSNRPRTTASVSWSPPAWNTVNEAGANQRTPNLTTVISEVTGRSGWNSGNALNVIVTGSGRRTAHAFDGSAGQAPLLHVVYDLGTNPQPQTLTFNPSADSSIQQNTGGTNYGTRTYLEIDSNPVQDFLLKFNVTIPTGKTVTSAKLRLHNIEGSVAGGRFHRTASTSWTETGVTWNNAPAADASPFATLGSVAANNWYEVTVPNVTANGTYGFRVKSTNSDGADYRSKEGGSATAPQLVLTIQ